MTINLLLTIAVAVSFSACDSSQKNAQANALEKMADNAYAVLKQSEAKADSLEAQKSMNQTGATYNQFKKVPNTQRLVGEANSDSLEKKRTQFGSKANPGGRWAARRKAVSLAMNQSYSFFALCDIASALLSQLPSRP